jgi:16S rRNA (guanine966-N2)-methyltransferase
MRIVAGTLRGRRLVAPKGHSTRPTADRVRQALFDVLEHAAWAPALAGLKVIDLFAGSGALGLEALSRGGVFCLFVDGDPAARAAIARNIETLGLTSRTQVNGADAASLGGGPAFDLAFLDPPYGQGLAERAMAALLSGGRLAAGAIVVVERGSAEATAETPGFDVIDERVWGPARVSFLKALGGP